MIAKDGKKRLHTRRIDQLLHLLLKTFQDYYLYKLLCKQAGYVSNPALDKRVKDVCQHADWSESKVQLPLQTGEAATVENRTGSTYHVTCPGCTALPQAANPDIQLFVVIQKVYDLVLCMVQTCTACILSYAVLPSEMHFRPKPL